MGLKERERRGTIPILFSITYIQQEPKLRRKKEGKKGEERSSENFKSLLHFTFPKAVILPRRSGEEKKEGEEAVSISLFFLEKRRSV